jgi:hypothetical protein
VPGAAKCATARLSMSAKSPCSTVVSGRRRARSRPAAQWLEVVDTKSPRPLVGMVRAGAGGACGRCLRVRTPSHPSPRSREWECALSNAPAPIAAPAPARGSRARRRWHVAARACVAGRTPGGRGRGAVSQRSGPVPVPRLARDLGEGGGRGSESERWEWG